MSDRPRNEPDWLTEAQVRMLHAEAIRLFGGSAGIRDEGLLRSALARPQNHWGYEQNATVFDLAAAYGFGIAKNHAFIDGNKRVALLAIRAFLFRNGHRFAPNEVETVTMMEGVAGGDVGEALLSEWIETNCERR